MKDSVKHFQPGASKDIIFEINKSSYSNNHIIDCTFNDLWGGGGSAWQTTLYKQTKNECR